MTPSHDKSLPAHIMEESVMERQRLLHKPTAERFSPFGCGYAAL